MVAIKNAFSLTQAMPLPWTSAADMAAALNLLRQVSCHPTLTHPPHPPTHHNHIHPTLSSVFSW